MKTTLLVRLLGCALVIFTAQAHATYVWLDKEAGTVKAYLGQLHAKKEAVSALVGARAYQANGGRDLGLTPETNSISISTPVSGDLRFTARAANDKDGLQYYHARFGRSDTAAASDLELVPTTASGNVFRLLWKGSPVAASQVSVSTGEGWSRTLKAESDGTVKLPVSFPGLYVLEVSVKVSGAITVDGKRYDEARHTATLSFIADSPSR
jgi:hypothetical protein